jgi:anti-sigma factor RsiW
MNSMNDQNFFDLAMKAMAGQASDAERAELDALLASQPELKAEFQRLQADVRTAKETLALVNATEATAGELPAYARGRLQTKVRQTLGRPQVSGEPEREQKMMWKWWWILGLATGAAAVVLLFLPMFTRPAGPAVQIAMLDTVGAVRGSDTNEIEILKQQWKKSDIQSFDNPALLESWETNWPEGDKVAAKVIYDRAAGEVRVLLRRVGKPQQRTFVIEHDLATTLREANAFIREQPKK